MKRNEGSKVKYYFPFNKEVYSCSGGSYSWLGLKLLTLAGLFSAIYLKCPWEAFQWIVSFGEETLHCAC